jgi:general secretion pathway protein M
MKPIGQKDGLFFAFGLLVVLLPLALAVSYVADRHRWGSSQLEQLEPRYARLLGLEAGRTSMAEAEAKTRAILASFAYSSERDDSQVGANAQQRIRDIFSAARLQVVSSQVLASKPERGFDRIPLSVRTEGDLLAFQTALVGVASQSPAIFVDGVSMQAIPTRADASQKVAVQFNLYVLRVRQ